MASEQLSFDILARDRASGAFRDAGRSAADLSGKMDLAARNARVLDEALSKQRKTTDVLAGATLATAKADKILADAERALSEEALAADFALKKETEAKKKSGEAAVKAAAENKTFGQSVQKAADAMKKGGGPGWLGPALLGLPAATTLLGVTTGAAIGLSGAFIAGAGALAGFGAVAKPVLSDALKAANAVNTAQNNYTASIKAGTKQATAYRTEQKAINLAYAELSPAQIRLSKELGNMAQSWQNVKASFTPLIASSLQPWLHGITTGIGSLGLVLKPMAPVIKGLGTQFDILVGSSAFKSFIAWIGTTGAAVNKAVGGAILDLITSLTFLLPKFTPLITGAANGLTHLADGLVRWSASGKASRDITAFMQWFHTNGPLVGTLLKNIGLALKALAPGLGTGAALELRILSDFFGFIAKLPASVAKPLLDVAGILLTLNKLGVFSVGVKIVGGAAGWVKKLLGGASVDLGAAGMQRAGDTMLTAAAAMQKAADTMVGGGAAGGAEGAAGRAAGGAGAGAAVEGTTVASLAAATLPVAMGLIGGVAIAYLVNNDAASKASAKLAAAALKNNNLTPGNVATGKQTGGVVPGVPNSAIGSWKQYDNVVGQAGRDQGTFSKNADIGRKAADALAGSVAALHQRNSQLASQFEQNLIPDLKSLGVDTPKVRTDVNNFADAVLNSGNQSKATRGDRQKLITDLENAGLNAKTARGLVDNMQTSINKLKGKTVGIDVHGSGSGTITFAQQVLGQNKKGYLEFHSAGALIPGYGGGDTHLAMLEGGETVVPKHLTPAVAPLMKAHRVPGFASGGLVGPGSVLNTGIPFEATVEGGAGAAAARSFASSIIAEIRAARSAAAASYPGGGSSGPGAAAAQRYAASILGLYGWGQNQMPPLISLWNRESGWQWNATNPSSGAYGIPQSLPADKMAAAGSDWRTNPATQIRWGLGYIKTRPGYGSPAAAWAHEVSAGWYDQGGYLPKGVSLAVNNTGYPEQVVPRGRGAAAPTVVLQVASSGSPFDRFMTDWLLNAVTVKGGGNVQVAFGHS